MAANKPGERNGGRPAGVPNRTTIERALEGERQIATARAEGKKLAKDVLEQFMLAFAAMAASKQPRPGNNDANVKDFEKWGKLAVATAARLAPFQSPTFRAIVITDQASMASGQIPGAPVVLPGNAQLLDFPTDAIGVSRIYRRLVDGTDELPDLSLPPGGLAVVGGVAIAEAMMDDGEVGAEVGADEGEVGAEDEEL